MDHVTRRGALAGLVAADVDVLIATDGSVQRPEEERFGTAGFGWVAFSTLKSYRTEIARGFGIVGDRCCSFNAEAGAIYEAASRSAKELKKWSMESTRETFDLQRNLKIGIVSDSKSWIDKVKVVRPTDTEQLKVYNALGKLTEGAHVKLHRLPRGNALGPHISLQGLHMHLSARVVRR